jgi:alpha-maltose-1-phosphate synthase
MIPPRPNAAFYFEAHNYRTAGDRVVGSQSANGGLLKGFIRHSGTDELCVYADSAADHADFLTFIRDLDATPSKIMPYLPLTMDQLADVGTLFRPGPDLGSLAWTRRHFDPRAFSLVGITHTVSDAKAMDVIGNLLIAPVEPWDALVCTSECVKGAVTRILDGWADYLEQRFAKRPDDIHMPIIPLGVDSDALAKRGNDVAVRADLRQRMNIADDDVVLLYAGRLDHVEKANPVPMLLAAESAAGSSAPKVHLIQAGQTSSKDMNTAFQQAATELAPSVTHHFIDGSMTDLYDGAWAAADIFISLSDNIQESFGLTPIEAMAAGLPCVVSDWDGCRETVRDGIDGFTIATAAPPPGAGEELGFLYGSGFANHPVFTGAASQSTAINPGACAEALALLINEAELRQRMGQSGQRHAAEIYDWRHVVTAHQELWAELGDIRRSSVASLTPRRAGAPAQPLRPDPFDIFQAHATTLLGGGTRLIASVALDADTLTALRQSELATPLAAMLLDANDTAVLLQKVHDTPGSTVAELARGVRDEHLTPFYLTLGWLAKMGFVRVHTGDGDHATELGPFGQSISWKSLIGG